MKQGQLLLRTLFALTLSGAHHAGAQDDIPEPTSGGRDSDAPRTSTSEENTEDNSVRKVRTKNIVSGTGFLLIAPHADVGYISTKPVSSNIFSKLESPASGYVIEPKVGLGIFSKKIALDLLVGAQIHSLAGERKGLATDFEYEQAEVTPLEKPESYKTEQTVPEVEGNARIRFGSGATQFGFSASALFGTKMALYSSIPAQGLKSGVLVGPQFVYETRDLSNYFRLSGAVQFLTTGNQRSAFVLKVGGAYGLLLNAPYLTVTEKRKVTSKVKVQKQVITTRSQTVVQSESVSFIFDSQMINFRFNSSELTEKSAAFVSGLGQIFAAQHSDWESLVVEGHTDSKGNNDYNKKLSQRRADSVRNLLIQNGVSANQIKAIGFGEEKLLITPEESDIDYARNRRVEIKVQGLRDARILQRSITRLQNQIFDRKTQGTPNSEQSEGQQGEQP